MLSIATTAGNEAAVVRVSEGLAQRDESGWRYVCPAAWGDDEAGPAVGSDGGPLFIGGSAGVFILDGDAGVAPHPAGDAARGRTLALAASAGHSWQLRANGADSSQLVELTREEVRVVATEVPPWESIAAGSEVVQLVRLAGAQIEELRLGPDGSELGRDAAPAPDGAVAAFARLAGGTPYIVLLTRGGLGSELGVLDGGAFRSLVTTSGSVAGPVALASGKTFVATAGRLAVLGDDGAVPVAGEEAVVTCLGKTDALRYACAGAAVFALEDDGLGAELFALDELGPPDTAQLDPELAARCELQWERFLVDLAAIGVVPRTGEDTASAPDSPDAATQPDDAGRPQQDADEKRTAHPTEKSGCNACAEPFRGGWLALALLLLVSRREKSAFQKKMTGLVRLWRD